MDLHTATIVFLPAIILGIIAVPTLLLSLLQLFLCRKEPRWGRILPIFSFIVSLLVVLPVVTVVLIVGQRVFGRWVFAPTAAGTLPALWYDLLFALALLIILNIPTLIYYLIYRSAKKKRAQEDVNRTRIDDLE